MNDEIGALEAIATTRSIHRYRATPIPDEHLAKILWSATRAPSGSNSQPFRFLVLRDGERATSAKALLGESFRRAWAAKSSGEGWDRGSGADANSPKARTGRAMQSFVDGFEQIPVVVLVCAMRYRDAHAYEGASIYPACQNLLLAARALGYGGTITIWHVACEAALRELLEIPENVFVAATIPLGVPEGRHGPLRRRPVGELVFDGAWGAPAEWIADESDARLSSSRSMSRTRFEKSGKSGP